MTAGDWSLLSRIIKAPSPVGLEGAMTEGVLAPFFASLPGAAEWDVHRSRGSTSMILDSMPPSSSGERSSEDDEPLTVMICGHSDKIRMQVRRRCVHARERERVLCYLLAATLTYALVASLPPLSPRHLAPGPQRW